MPSDPRTFLNTDLYAITDAGLSRGRSTVEVARELLAAGVRLLQYREKDKPAGERLEEARALRALTREAGAGLIVNDHVDLALLCDADGVHVGQDDLPPAAVRELIGPRRLIGVSTHAPEQARLAIAEGADYLGIGPVFATATKRDVCRPVGLDYVAFAAREVAIPWVAIGGIKRDNVATVVRQGARLVALVSELVAAPDIALRVREVRSAMVK